MDSAQKTPLSASNRLTLVPSILNTPCINNLVLKLAGCLNLPGVVGWHGRKHIGEDLLEALKAIEGDLDNAGSNVDSFNNPEKPTGMKIKSFDLAKLISMGQNSCQHLP